MANRNPHNPTSLAEPTIVINVSSSPQGLLNQVADVGLLGSVWPKELIFFGLCVSKKIRSELLKQVNEVEIAARGEGTAQNLSGSPRSFLISMQTGHMPVGPLARKDLRAQRALQQDGHFRVSAAQVCKTLLLFQNTTVAVKGGKLPGEVILGGVLTAVCSGFGQTLSHFDLQGCKIGEKGCINLSLVLRQCRNVSQLNLYDNKIGDLGATRLAPALPRGIKLLNLGGNMISAQGMQILGEHLVECEQLTHLDLFKNSLEAEGTAILSKVVEQCKRLTYLDLTANRSCEDGVQSLSSTLGECRALKSLLLRNSLMGDKGMQSLAPLLPRFENLSHLDLRIAFLSQEGISTLFSVLPQCRNITHLNLGQNGLKTSGAAALAKILGHWPMLLNLELDQNFIGDTGAKLLAESIARGECSQLRSLNLEKNCIQDEGVKQLAEALEQCSGLEHLNLKSNEIGAEGAESLKELMALAHARCRPGPAHAGLKIIGLRFKLDSDQSSFPAGISNRDSQYPQGGSPWHGALEEAEREAVE